MKRHEDRIAGADLRVCPLYGRWLAALIIIIACCGYGEAAQELPFKDRETLSFSVEMFGMKIGAQTMQSCILPGSQTIQLISETRTLPFASKIYKLHNRIETHICLNDSLPVHIKNQVQEGKYVKHWDAELDQKNHLGTITMVESVEPEKRITIPANTINIPGLIYYLRTRELKPGDSFSLALLKESEAEGIILKVEKREKIRVPYGDFSALKVISSSGGVIVWFSPDRKHLPIRIECQTNAGWLRAELAGVR